MKYTEELIEELVFLYTEKGLSALAIAKSKNLDPDTVAKHLKNQGLRLSRGRGRPKPKIDDFQRKELSQMYLEGISLDNICDHFKCGRTLMYKTLRESNVISKAAMAREKEKQYIDKINKATKVCSRCKLEQSLNQFGRSSFHKDGFRGSCKSCAKDNSHKPLERVYKSRQRNRQYVWDYCAMHPCVDCGYDNPRALDFDHIRGDKVMGVSQMAHGTSSLERIQAEIDKCDVVCANCHRLRTCETQGWYSGIVMI